LAGVLTYALVLQGLAFALAPAEPARDAEDLSWASAELCIHSTNGTSVPGKPGERSAADAHCLFCIPGAVYVDSTPPAAPQLLGSVLAEKVATLTAPRLLALLVHQSAWPRGPPAAA
jgi:hypothetical protein